MQGWFRSKKGSDEPGLAHNSHAHNKQPMCKIGVCMYVCVCVCMYVWYTCQHASQRDPSILGGSWVVISGVLGPFESPNVGHNL